MGRRAYKTMRTTGGAVVPLEPTWDVSRPRGTRPAHLERAREQARARFEARALAAGAPPPRRVGELAPPLVTMLDDGTTIRTEAHQLQPASRGRVAITAVYRPGKRHYTERWQCAGAGAVSMARRHDEVVALATARRLDYQVEEDRVAAWRAAHPGAVESSRRNLARARTALHSTAT